MLTQFTPQRFSEFFKLPKDEDFDFLDIYAHQDISLFLDPYGISAINSTWARKCESKITTYFQFLVDSIHTGDKKTIRKLLDALHEVDEVGLGYSAAGTSGRGIGPVQASEILKAFETSQAAQSGDIKDLADCALMIPGINRDKISDITANILKKELIEYTQLQCSKYGISTSRVPVNAVFDAETLSFTSVFALLPVIEGKPKILLPVRAVRRTPELSKDKFYRNFVLEFLKAEHEHAGDSLASVLKNGRIIVRIEDLKKKYPLKTDFLYEFSKQHPKILERFKTELRRSAGKDVSPVLPVKRKILTADERISLLASIKSGNDNASNFHKLSFDNLINIFGKRLSKPEREREINSGRKRIDIVFHNPARNGFFSELGRQYQVKCPKIFVECKNYGKEIGNPELDQLLGRFSSHRGKFGILVCRSIKDQKLLLKRAKDLVNDHQAFIIVLDDSDISNLLKYREKKQEDEIDLLLRTKFDKLIM